MMPLTRRQGLGLTAGLAAAALVPSARAQAPRNVLVGGFDVGPGGFQGNFNPLAASAGFQWLNLYYETLVSYDATLSGINGALAARMEVSADNARYTFHLADGVTWHDGKPFTSADVAFTVALAKDPKSGSIFPSRLADIATVETPDPATAVFVLSKPNASLPDILVRLMMLPQHALAGLPRDGLDRNPWWAQTPIGTGPFSFVRYQTDQFVELKANPHYRLGKPKLDGVINRYFKDTAGAVAALRAKEIQFSYVESDDAQAFRSDAGFAVIEGNSWVENYVGFNYGAGLWNDVRVRQALMHAINRPAIVKSLFKDTAAIANSVYIAPSVVPPDLDLYPYDPARAMALLKDAGWDKINGAKPLPMPTYYNTPLVANVMAAMQAMLGQVGINVVPRAVDVATYNGMVYASSPDHSQYPLVYAGAQNGPDPGGINMYVNESQIPPAGSNVMRIREPGLNAALNTALAEADATRRQADFQQVARVFNQQVPWAPMWVGKRYGVAAANLHDFVWTPAPSGGGYQQHAETWSLA